LSGRALARRSRRRRQSTDGRIGRHQRDPIFTVCFALALASRHLAGDSARICCPSIRVIRTTILSIC
jgi:hypothetical protein